MIEPKDEQLHDYGPHPDWQESFYFNWADPERRAFTLARIGYRFNVGKTDGLIVSLRDGEVELFYGPADIDHEGPCSDEDPARGLRARRFVVTMQEPLRRWHLELEGDQSMDLVFEAHTPVFDYHEGGRRLASTMTGQHFEQTGSVTGWTCFGGRRHEIRAFGQRDKSWGVRDWDRLEGWNWISGQFGADLSFNVMQTFENGEPLDNGFVFRDGANHAIERVEIDYSWGRQPHLMREARLHIVEAGGTEHRVRAHALASAPILRTGVWLEETHAEFELETAQGPRPGQGVVEHVWRAGAAAIARRAPRLAALFRLYQR
jgi:hypothetical protein